MQTYFFECFNVRSGQIVDFITSSKYSYLFGVINFGNKTKVQLFTIAYVPGKLTEKKSAWLCIQVSVITNLDLPVYCEFFREPHSTIFVVPKVNGDSEAKITLLKIDKPAKDGLEML